MKIKHLLSLIALAITIFSCTPENLQAPNEDKPLTFKDINLQEGLSKWLTTEQQARFSDAELAELDALLIDETLPNGIESRTTVEVPAESQDALAAAIAEAGEGGTVILKAGNHYESSTVNITQRVIIRGEKGAILISDVQPVDVAGVIEPALHIQDAANVVVLGVNFQPTNVPGGTAILVDNARRSFLVRNTTNDFQFGIVLEQGNQARVVNNTINTTPAALAGELFVAHGLMIVNGDQTRIINNTFTSSTFGAWTCDENGLYIGNTTTGNFAGHVLCNVPPEVFVLPSGESIGSEIPGKNWLVLYNESYQNFFAGYLVIDGASENYLAGNNAYENASYDFELAGDSERFGFFTPKSVDNKVLVGNGMKVKDCGENNEVIGGEQVDTTADPCF